MGAQNSQIEGFRIDDPDNFAPKTSAPKSEGEFIKMGIIEDQLNEITENYKYFANRNHQIAEFMANELVIDISFLKIIQNQAEEARELNQKIAKPSSITDSDVSKLRDKISAIEKQTFSIKDKVIDQLSEMDHKYDYLEGVLKIKIETLKKLREENKLLLEEYQRLEKLI